MKDLLADVREKLSQGAFQNEEHVRLSLVARILQALGWDVWNPAEVNSEFKPVPEEDKTKVDLALFATPHVPSVFIEVKPHGKMDVQETEQQLRDYNRNNTATFSTMTDGQRWRFYYSQTGGTFSQKCFKEIDLSGDGVDDIETVFKAFLDKTNILNRNAEEEARKLLALTLKQKAMADVLPEARNLTERPPFPSLPAAIVQLLDARGIHATVEEATEFLATYVKAPKPPSPPEPTDVESPGRGNFRSYDPDKPPSLAFARVIGAEFGGEQARSWADLVKVGLCQAWNRGHRFPDISAVLSGGLRKGVYSEDGYDPVSGTNLSYQKQNSAYSWRNALALARLLRQPIRASFRWGEKAGPEYSGKEGALEWRP